MNYKKKVIIHIGFDCEFEYFDDAIKWIHKQDDYKDKSALYVISAGSEVEID